MKQLALFISKGFRLGMCDMYDCMICLFSSLQLKGALHIYGPMYVTFHFFCHSVLILVYMRKGPLNYFNTHWWTLSYKRLSIV